MNENIIPHSFTISRQDRSLKKGQQPYILWFTGLSASGKSTIANLVENKLSELGKHTYVLDGDQLRVGLCKDLGFSVQDRQENIRRVSEVARILYDAGIIVICSFISPFRKERATARLLFDENDFIEIYVDTPLELCKKRDYKGLYAKAEVGIITNLTGVNSPYEPPYNAEIVLKTTENSAEESALLVIEFISNRISSLRKH